MHYTIFHYFCADDDFSFHSGNFGGGPRFMLECFMYYYVSDIILDSLKYDAGLYLKAILKTVSATDRDKKRIKVLKDLWKLKPLLFSQIDFWEILSPIKHIKNKYCKLHEK